jgi:hypothetical protein
MVTLAGSTVGHAVRQALEDGVWAPSGALPRVTTAGRGGRRFDLSAKSDKHARRTLARVGGWVYCRGCADHGARLG